MHFNRAAVYALLASGIAIVSTAAILIRLAQGQGASSLIIATTRLAVAAVILTVPVLITQRAVLRAVSLRDFGLAVLAGIALAAHFVFWIRSLESTSVAASTVLVTTNPLWVALASVLIFHERLTRRVGVGIAMTLAGTICMFWFDSTYAFLLPGTSTGNLLALSGALCMSAYLLIGRSLRRKLSLLTYVWLVYSMAALTLLLTCAATGQSISGVSTHALAFMLALALGPQLLGHTIINWSLRHVSATCVALSILGEPIGSALLAVALFNESISALQLLAYALILGGIALSALAETKHE